MVSPLLCPIHEDTPGPLIADLSTGTLTFRATGDPAERVAGKLTLAAVREQLAHIVGQRVADDPHLHYLDGRKLYGEADAVDLPLPDALHPDASTHHLVGESFAPPRPLRVGGHSRLMGPSRARRLEQ